jgi:predicted dehydrogenase
VLNDEVTQVTATAASDERSGDVESAASLTLKFSRGTIGTVLVSYRAAYRTPLELVGDAGVIKAENALNVEYPIEIELEREGKVVEAATVSNQAVYALQVDAFADAIEGKSKFPIPGEEGWQNQEVLDAAMRSLRTGKSEDVPRAPA